MRFFCGTMKNPAKRKFHYLVFRKYNTTARCVPKNKTKFKRVITERELFFQTWRHCRPRFTCHILKFI